MTQGLDEDIARTQSLRLYFSHQMQEESQRLRPHLHEGTLEYRSYMLMRFSRSSEPSAVN